MSRARLAGRFSPEQIAELWPAYPADAPVTIAQARDLIDHSVTTQLAHLLPPSLEPSGASNIWALNGKHTANGSPILANDPHLSLDAPGTWFLARLEAPGITLVGATTPGVPFILLGHNQTVAWGLTTTHSDTQDFFIERIAADDPNAYETPEGSEPFRVRDEFIRLSGGESVRLIVRETRHGPVMSDVVPEGSSGDSNAVLALAWPALRADDATPDALYQMNHADSLIAFRESLRQFHSPQQNIVFADTAGNIGFMAPARVPVRRTGNGQLPVPGWTGEFDWIGYVPFEELPSTNNPRSGIIINANNRIVADKYPHLIAVDWPPPYRAERIEAVLAGTASNHQVTDSLILQQDIVANAADRILPRLLAVSPTEARAREAIARLRGWDRQMHRNAPEPLILQAWIWALGQAILADELGPNYLEFLDGGVYTVDRLIETDSMWCDDTATTEVEDCNAQIIRALDMALDHLSDRFGSDMASWRWGKAHLARFDHPLLSRLPVLRDLFGYSVEADGGNDTVNRASPRLGGKPETLFEDVHGAGFRAVYDLEDLDRSRFMIATGQSGNPLSPLYGNMALRWRDGQSVSLAPESWTLAEQLSLLPSQK